MSVNMSKAFEAAHAAMGQDDGAYNPGQELPTAEECYALMQKSFAPR